MSELSPSLPTRPLGGGLLVLGVLNVTPDSFSDGGRYDTVAAALEGARRLVAEGADILDIGGESTRPGAEPVSEDEELRRVLPVVEACVRELGVPVSVDTRKFAVAEAAVRAGATIVNDVSGGTDERLPSLFALGARAFVLMHMQGDPRTMQREPQYPGGVVEELQEFFLRRVEAFVAAGVPYEALWIDPGIGFGKTFAHNRALLARLDAFRGIGARLCIGTSRKSFLALCEDDAKLPFASREPGMIATNLWAYQKGATVFRVHEPALLVRALRAWRTLDSWAPERSVREEETHARQS